MSEVFDANNQHIVDVDATSEYEFALGATYELPIDLPNRTRELAIRYPGVRRTITEYGITVLHYLDARELNVKEKKV